MSWYRLGLFLVLPCVTGVFAVAVAQQTTPPAKPAPPAAVTPPRADPAATANLDRALELFDPKRGTWLQTSFWQQVDVQNLTFQAEGTYLSGPGNRARLDLKVRLGGTEGKLQVVSDGTTLWQTEQIGSAERTAFKADLKKVLEALNHPSTEPQVRAEFHQSQSLAGLGPLLQTLKQTMTFTRQEEARWKDRPVIKLTGLWKTPPVADKNWPAYLPRYCSLYLDPESRWPWRLEWWGPTVNGGADSILLQMEFRDPGLRQKLPDQQFAFDPGSLKLEDRTDAWVKDIAARSQFLRDQRKNAPSPPNKP